ncbi:MAG: hypothetical protein D6706_16255, partial [Chloroflexi bacterium]
MPYPYVSIPLAGIFVFLQSLRQKLYFCCFTVSIPLAGIFVFLRNGYEYAHTPVDRIDVSIPLAGIF